MPAVRTMAVTRQPMPALTVDTMPPRPRHHLRGLRTFVAIKTNCPLANLTPSR